LPGNAAERYAAAARAEARERGDPLRTFGYVLVLIAVPLSTCNALRAGQNVTYGDIPLALATVLLLGSWLVRGLPRGVVPAGLPLAALLLLAAGVLAIVPAENLASLLPTLRFAVTLGLTPVIIMLAAGTPRRVRTLVDVWLLGAAVNSAVAALDMLGVTSIGTSLLSLDFVNTTNRAPGLTNHPNHLGLVAAMALPVAIARLGAGGMRGLAACGLVPLLIGGVFVSGSRGAFIAAAAGAVILFAFGTTTRRARTTLLLFGAPVVAFVVVVVMLGNNALAGSVTIERLGGGGGATQSDNARLLTLRQSVDKAIQHPLVGVGFVEVRTAHNIYVQLLEAGGLIALAGFLAFAGAMVRRARRLALPGSGSPPWLMSLAAGSGASICVWLLFGMVGNAVYDRYLYIPVGVVLALALMHDRWFARDQQPPRPNDPPSPLRLRHRAPAPRAGNRLVAR
jgi:O-antigen ligase